tara:strand:+ start:5359 stop:6180 length:822 start_codon:yes stop_codon:yes gene_type:complete
MISFITTFYNEEKTILKFLNSLIIQSLKVNEYILVDGGSSDDTVFLITQFIESNNDFNFKLIVDDTCNLKHSKGPVARGRNIAINRAKNSIIAVSDAGCVLDKDWLYFITKPLIEKKAQISSGISKFSNSKEVFASEDIIIHNNYKNPSSRNLAFLKFCWKDTGGYPENYLTGEDTAFNRGLVINNYVFIFASKALVYWDAPKNQKELISKQLGYGKGDGFNQLFFMKYCFRFFALLFPFYYLKKKSFTKSYLSAISYQRGYTQGLFEYFFSK